MKITAIKQKLASDFVLVLLANIFSYFITFSGSVIYVRMLGKEDFGLYTFAFNIISFFLLVNGFGAASGVLQFVSRAEKSADRLNILHFAFYSGIIFNFIIGLLIILYAYVMPLPIPHAKILLLLMAFFPVGRLYIDIFQAYLRATGQNIQQAKFLILNSLVLLICNIIGIILFKLNGLIYFTYLAYLLMFIVSCYLFKLPRLLVKPSKLALSPRKFISYSFFTTLSNAFSGLLFVLDIFLISYIVKSPALIASYRVATIIPFAINFIPNVAINFYYPEFAKNANNPAKIRQLARYVSSQMFIFSSGISLFLILAARPLILGIFGANYQESILPFQIISFGFWIIASFRTVNGNIIAALGFAKLSFYITSIVLILNIIITYMLVKHYLIIGAALAIVIIYSISSLLGYISLQLILKSKEK